MRVAIDTRWIFREISGIGAHTRQLVRHIVPLDGATEFVLLFHDPFLRDRTLSECDLTGASNVTAALLPWGVFSPAGQLWMPDWLRRNRIDVFHSTNYMMPLLAFPRNRKGRTRAVITVHDLIPLVAPDATPRALKRRLFPLYRRLMREVAARADRIIAVSEASRQDVLKHLAVGDPTRVRVIYNGVDAIFRPATGPARLAAAGEQARPERVVLYVGRSDPYKNLTGLIRAFAEVRGRAAAPMRLRIVGPPDRRYPEPVELVRALGLTGCVDFDGYMNDAGLVAAYQSADVLVLPSRFEGFGFPVVEAMACGTPVVCSDIPVLREIAGDAAEYAALDDTAGLGAAILRVIEDPARRAAMTAGGRERAARYTWDRAARDTLALYREVSAPVSEIPQYRRGYDASAERRPVVAGSPLERSQAAGNMSSPTEH